jgi:hypothetical protein
MSRRTRAVGDSRNPKERKENMDGKNSLNVVKQGLPQHLQHTPVVAADYQKLIESQKQRDYSDPKFLSIGHAQYNSKECSVKMFRKTVSGRRWSRQSEEVPIQRLPYMMAMLLSAIYHVQNPETSGSCSRLNEDVVVPEDMSFIESQLQKRNGVNRLKMVCNWFGNC